MMASLISKTGPGVKGKIRGLRYGMREGFPSHPNIIKPLYRMTQSTDSDAFLMESRLWSISPAYLSSTILAS